MDSLLAFEECSASGYPARTVMNARLADCTIAFAINFSTPGETLTRNSVARADKLYASIYAMTAVPEYHYKEIIESIRYYNCRTFNIAGNGIDKFYFSGRFEQHDVDAFVLDSIKKINSETKIEHIRCGGQSGADEAGAKAGIILGIPTLILAPKGWMFVNKHGKTICDEKLFKQRFENYEKRR